VPTPHAVYQESFHARLEMSEPFIPLIENVIVRGAPPFHILGPLFGMGPLFLTGANETCGGVVSLDVPFALFFLTGMRYSEKDDSPSSPWGSVGIRRTLP